MASRASVRIPLALAFAFALAGCSSFDLARVLKKPEVTVKGAEIELLTFEEARIRFDVALANPNPVGVRLAGFDYRLNLDGAEFLNGTVDREVSIAAHASSTVPVPVAFRHEADAIGPRSRRPALPADHAEPPLGGPNGGGGAGEARPGVPRACLS